MSYRSEPVTMWFDRRIVMRTSPIHGIGTFASEDIRASETLIWVTGGIVFSPADWQAGKVQLAGEMYNEERLADDLVIVTPVSFHYYLNHSCQPNAVDQSQHPTWTHYIAARYSHERGDHGRLLRRDDAGVLCVQHTKLSVASGWRLNCSPSRRMQQIR